MTDKRQQAIPEWPCPNCGGEDWDVMRPFNPTPPILWPVTCCRCKVVVDHHWVDGAWVGRWWGAGRPGCMADFVSETARELRTT